MRYTHILFDADDTLFDFQAGFRTALTQTVRELVGRDIPDAIEIYHKGNRLWWDAFERGEATMEQLSVGRFVDFMRNAELEDCGYTAEQWRDRYEGLLGEQCIHIDGAQELCERLAKNCRLYIITNGITHVQKKRLSLSPIKEFFSGVFISQELGVRKPQKEYFDIVLNTLGDADKSRILVVGDSLSSDMRGGINAGLDVCWYNPHGKQAEDIALTYTVSHLSEVADIVEGK